MSRKMKDSGVEWIGEIPESWSTIRIKNIAQLCGRIGWQGLQASEYTDDGPYIISGMNFYNNIIDWDSCNHFTKERFEEDVNIHVHENDLLITKDGTIGKVAIAKNCPKEVSLNSGVMKIVLDKSIDTKYMLYVLLSDVFWKWYTTNQRGNSTIKHLYQEQFYNFSFPLPFKDGKTISNYLDIKCSIIDSLINETIKTIEEYKKLKQSIITEAVTKGIRKNRPMKDSRIEWIGDIPNNWFIVKIKNIATTSSGGTPNSSDHSLYDGDINWMCTYDLEEKPLFESKRKITEKGASQIAGSLQTKGTVLVSMYGGSSTIGKTGILECEARTNQAICSIKFDKQYVDNYYGFYYIQSIKNEWMRYAEGTRKDPNISQTIVNEMSFVVPPIEEQKEIVQYLNDKCITIDEIIKKKNTVIKELELYKKSIIYEYVTGKKEIQPTIACSEE